MGIPKIIHQIWFQGEDEIPGKYQKYIQTVIKFNPDFRRILWDSKKIDNLIKNDFPKYYDFYCNLPLMIQKIDLAKYFILYHYGGVYIDLDTYCLNPINQLLKKYSDKELICAKIWAELSNCYRNIAVHLFSQYFNNYEYLNDPSLTSFRNLNRIYLNNDTIFASPQNGFLKLLIKNIRKQFKPKMNIQNDVYVCITTGPLIFKDTYLDYVNKYTSKGMIILDHGFQVGNTKFLHHDNQFTWASNTSKNMEKILKFMKKYGILFLSLIILIIVIRYRSIT